MSHEDIVAWEGFAVALAGAVAVLAGLVFVAVSINSDRILPVRGLPGRAGESVILFITALTTRGLVAGVLTTLVVGTGNAWGLLVEVVRDRRYQPANIS
jgi:hypothetical protein